MLNREEKASKARALFLSGYSCSQSVMAAFAPEMGMSEKEAARLASGLGGGLGSLRLICGALTAACVVLGRLLGFEEPDEPDRKKWLYTLEQNLAARFTETYGTVQCRELMVKARETAEKESVSVVYEKRPCGVYVEAMTRLVADVLNENAE